MRFLSKLNQKNLNGKRVLLRVNLDLKNMDEGSLRLQAALGSLKYLIENGAKPMILSHRGRPKGEDKELSLEPMIDWLKGQVGNKFEWLENLRFDQREGMNDLAFARDLAKLGDLYVNDDFATAHRACASNVNITKFLPGYVGLLLEKELEVLTKVRDNPRAPLVVVIGGSKIDDKVGVIENLYDKAKVFLMGSAYLGLENKCLKKEKVMLPQDSLIEEGRALEIGEKTIADYCEKIKGAKTVIWNGPLGVVEDPRYVASSLAIAKAILESGAYAVVGGGDTQQFLAKNGLEEKFSFVSTGGGAMLDFLAGKTMPAVEALEKFK